MENLLQGLGIFACVGVVLLVLVGVLIFRALSRSRKPTQDIQREEPTVWREQGSERPRYDTREVESKGGFGGVPQTGSSVDRDVSDRGVNTSGARYYSDRESRSGGLPPLDPDPGQDRPPQRGRDDDDVRSGGGFGS